MDDRWKFSPPEDVAILPWYSGIYSRAFIALHPFFTIEGLDPASCSHEPVVLMRSDAPDDTDIIEWMNVETEKRPAGKEFGADAVDLAAKRFGQKLSWRTVCDAAGFADYAVLDRALRTHIGGLRAEFEDGAGAERLVRYCRQQRIFLPSVGNFPSILQPSLAELFRRCGVQELIVANEFSDVERLLPLQMVDRGAPWDGGDHLVDHGVQRLFAPDRSLLVWVHWDSFFTVVLGTEARLHDADIETLLEGFWCSDETRVYWLNQPGHPPL